MRSMTGLLSYYRVYVPHFASVVKPLTDLTRGKNNIDLSNPSEDALRAFQDIKYYC